MVLGPWAFVEDAEKKAKELAQRIGHASGREAECVLLDAPYQLDNSLEAPQHWFRIVSRSPEDRRRDLRKQSSTGLTTLFDGAVRWGPDVIAGIGQGGLVVALAALPLVLEAACRWRIVTAGLP